MTALRGDEFVLQAFIGSAYVDVLTSRSTSFSQSREIIDVTTKASSKDRTLLEGGGVASRSITLEGVFEEDEVYEAMQTRYDNGSIDTYRLFHITSGIRYEGDFQIESFELAGEYNNSFVYSLTLQSSGEVVKTDTISD